MEEKKEKAGFQIGDMLSFEKLIAPTLIKIVYYIGLAGIAFWALVAIATAFSWGGGGIVQVIVAIFGFVFGVLFWRVMMELYTVLFGIYERLGEIRDKGRM